MAALFTLPGQEPLSTGGLPMAGCKLTFSIAGSSTPQNTYQDADLTTPHANPVVADAAGLFAAIYLDPRLPAYRVVLSTSANVTLKTWDNVPSNQNTAQQFTLVANAPYLQFTESDAATDNKKWRLKVNGEGLLLTILNDAESIETNVFAFERTGTTPGDFNFTGQYLRVAGNLVATQQSGSFTATLTGFTTTVTGTVKWWRSGSKIGFFVPTAITGTSNSTSMGMNGMPSDLLMGSNSCIVLTRVLDNNVIVLGTVTIRKSTDGSPGMAFGVGAASLGAIDGLFQNTGTKGLPAGTYWVYDSDGVSIA